MTDLVLFGITGDLSKQKLIPALYTLWQDGLFASGSGAPEPKLIGFGRKSFTKEEFGQFIADCIKEAYKGNESEDRVKGFVQMWHYVTSELDSESGYKELAEILKGNAVIYLSLPPQLQLSVSEHLIRSGAVTRENGRSMAFEKPFGHNGESATALNAYLTAHLDARQILRVDHYAGKQALIELHQAARLPAFAPFFNSSLIEKIEVRLHEQKTAKGRGAFYDGVGALNDIGQNHLLYMLCTVMRLAYAEKNSETKTGLEGKIIDSLEPYGKQSFAQYEGFKDEPGVKPDSTTETSFVVHLRSSLEEWKDTDIQLSGGKALADNDVSITLYLRNSLNGQSSVRIPVNGYGSTDPYAVIFETALSGNKPKEGKNKTEKKGSGSMAALAPDKDSIFITFEQIMAGWKLVDKIKRDL